MTLAFVSSSLARDAHFRSKISELQAQGRPVRVIEAASSGARIVDEGLFAIVGPASPGDIFLGTTAEGTAWFARKAQSPEGLTGLRDLMLAGTLPPETLSLLAQACSLLGWHETHGFCAACGVATEMADAGYRRHCGACGKDHFPRTDPVVIMAVTHGNAVLLGRQAAWRPGMYSALAGFMEPGETIEQAAAREVLEEAGVVIHDVRYVTSQPWPFPSNLMIGVVAKANARAITVDKTELEDARWFEKPELELMLEARHPEGLTATNPYAIAHHIIMHAVRKCR